MAVKLTVTLSLFIQMQRKNSPTTPTITMDIYPVFSSSSFPPITLTYILLLLYKTKVCTTFFSFYFLLLLFCKFKKSLFLCAFFAVFFVCVRITDFLSCFEFRATFCCETNLGGNFKDRGSCCDKVTIISKSRQSSVANDHRSG